MARDPLRSLYKVPLASETPLQFVGRALARIPRLTAIATKSTREPSLDRFPLGDLGEFITLVRGLE